LLRIPFSDIVNTPKTFKIRIGQNIHFSALIINSGRQKKIRAALKEQQLYKNTGSPNCENFEKERLIF
tara:strand:+ start:273 stop:476 length:204 start_codon:yes stop_codon:yes gene_type:complete